jgi:excisionase family DNA binding protein
MDVRPGCPELSSSGAVRRCHKWEVGNLNNKEKIVNIASRFVTLSELTVELAASRSAVRRWLEDGDVTAYAFGSGRNAELRYEREDVDEWIARSGGGGEDQDEDEIEDDGVLEADEADEADDEDEDGADTDDADDTDDTDDTDDASEFDLDLDSDEGDDE